MLEKPESKNFAAVIQGVTVSMNDHSFTNRLWDFYINFTLQDGNRTEVTYFLHTGNDKSAEELIPDFFKLLKKFGLPNTNITSERYVNLLKNMEKEIKNNKRLTDEFQCLEEKLYNLNQHMTDCLQNKLVRVEVSPWPLRSSQSYKLKF